MSIISTNKTRWGLFALVLMSSAVSFGQFSGACFQYDAAGNRIKRSACQIETVPPEEKSPGSYSEFLALPNSTLAESGAISANVSKKGEVLGQAKLNEGRTNVSPNPTSLGVTIETDEFGPTATLELLDATGKVLQRQPLNNGQLDLTAYEAGTYNLRLSSATNLKTLRIVKVCQ